MIEYALRTIAFALLSLFIMWAIGAFGRLDPWFWANPSADVGRAWAAIFSLIFGAWAAAWPGFDK